MVACVVLAGGLGRRMGGGDKPFRLLAARPLLDHVIARVRPQASALALNANGDPARFAAWGLKVLPDTLPNHPGPLAGILAGMRWAAEQGFADLLSVPTDTPFLPADLAVRLVATRAAAGTPLACATSRDRRHPVVGLWPVSLAYALEASLRDGARRIEAWTAERGIAHADFAGDPDPFFNTNTPVELAEAERMLRSTLRNLP